VVGYRRCSHPTSEKSGLGLQAQTEAIEAFVPGLLKRCRQEQPDLHWAGWFEDISVSAYARPLLRRKGGRKLDAFLRRGDHVIFATLDRGFRDAHDFLSVYKRLWEPRGVVVHFLDLPIDTSSPLKDLLLTIIAVVAEWSSKNKSERNRRIAEVSRRLNRPLNQHQKLGFKLHGPPGARQWVVDIQQRLILDAMEQYDRQGITHEEIHTRLTSRVERYVREFAKHAGHGGRYCVFNPWTVRKVTRLIQRYRRLQQQEAIKGAPVEGPAGHPPLAEK
jgi:DNA invertase Pin-like site-specific DNA recombinase